MVKAEINDQPISFDGSDWAGPDPEAIADAQLYERLYWEGGPDYRPDRNNAIVEFVVEHLGGRIVAAETVEFDANAIY